MIYRPEIDGLRALAVVPVVLFHAGVPHLDGGFVGVDVFFVISGYLITSIILRELQDGRFSIAHFYERRARRILPALYLVMAVSALLAHTWMLPDEYKNFGQSVLATALFSNNVLLYLTSGYWDLASEFKPLLHTWSLGVEEQYYVVFPIAMLACWRYLRGRTFELLVVLAVVSFLASLWCAVHYPRANFYLLPTRAWEILLGAICAFHLARQPSPVDGALPTTATSQLGSALGIALIVLSVLLIEKQHSWPGLTALAPTLATALIIVFAHRGTAAHAMLSQKALVAIGLISYSLYLWHQPVIAFSKIYSAEPPAFSTVLALVALAVLLSYLSWRFVERPFRSSAVVGRSTLAASAVLATAGFVLFGFHLNASYGLPARAFDASIGIADLDKRIYNEGAFKFKVASFSGTKPYKVLIIGNSFGRDFVNMTRETFDLNNIELVYRDDLTPCVYPYKNDLSARLFGDADVIVFASGDERRCVTEDVAFATSRSKGIYYIGKKHFGHNLNWLIRLDENGRRNQKNRLPAALLLEEREAVSQIPRDRYISLLGPIVEAGAIPITDSEGRLLSTDREHLTKFGAAFFGERVLRDSPFGRRLVTWMETNGK